MLANTVQQQVKFKLIRQLHSERGAADPAHLSGNRLVPGQLDRDQFIHHGRNGPNGGTDAVRRNVADDDSLFSEPMAGQNGMGQPALPGSTQGLLGRKGEIHGGHG